jgi:galactokinase
MEVTAWAPGRVNLIGEHTDYNGGLALPFAIGPGVTVRATALPGERLDAVALDPFVRGCVAELRAAGHSAPDARIEISSDLPQGAGLSSSAAFSAALCLALLGVAGEQMDRLDLARLCSRVENEWVGARTGLLDQLAVLMCREDHALLIDFESLALSHVPLELGEWMLAVVDSGVRREHAASGYNERRAECARACELLGAQSLRRAAPADAAALPPPLDRRVRHVIEENARVEAAVAALERGDVRALGALLGASHESLRDLYDVSVPEIEDLIAGLDCAGARMIGGGFGGSVLALFEPDAALPANAMRVTAGGAARLS